MQNKVKKLAIIIGSGPTGLMAAEQLVSKGLEVLVAERKPSLARKFLMAGKSGLNLTNDDKIEEFTTNFYEASEWLDPIFNNFRPRDVIKWAEGLNEDLFVGSSGRIFPLVMKASPILRSWIIKLKDEGVSFKTGWNWTGWKGDELCFDTPEGPTLIRPSVTVLCLGGGSWKRLGSNGLWVDVLEKEGVEIEELKSANVGLLVSWSKKVEAHFGKPLKNIAFSSGSVASRGEAVISKKGLEGSAIYSMTKSIRNGNKLILDLLPDLTENVILHKINQRKSKISFSNFLRKSLKLSPQKITLFYEFGMPLPLDNESLAFIFKNLQVNHQGPGLLDEAISTSGGIKKKSFNNNLMLHARPGVFVAGEMLDWEAPTGGYLLTACLSLGYWAGIKAAEWVNG
ncbi:TIGR03862 family flavoprotein [bacterium]|nr:TIGR03862 family flavoprotein [bacterium]